MYVVLPGLAFNSGSVSDFKNYQNYGLWGWGKYNLKKASPYGTFFDNAVKEQKERGVDDEQDLLDVPLSVLKMQAKLDDLFDDDKWRTAQLEAQASMQKGNKNEGIQMSPFAESSVEVDENGTEEHDNIFTEILQKIDPRFPELYGDAFVEAELETTQLRKLTVHQMVELLDMPLGHALKISSYFEE